MFYASAERWDEMSENPLLLVCGLSGANTTEEWSFVGIAAPDETPYDFSSRLFSMGYARVTTVPLWRLPQFPRAWQQFLEHNQHVGVRSEG
jgi:hypothetical protein